MKYISAFYFLNENDGVVSCPYIVAANTLKKVFSLVYEEIQAKGVNYRAEKMYIRINNKIKLIKLVNVNAKK